MDSKDQAGVQKSHVEISLDLRPGERVRLTIEARPGDQAAQVVREDLSGAGQEERISDLPPNQKMTLSPEEEKSTLQVEKTQTPTADGKQSTEKGGELQPGRTARRAPPILAGWYRKVAGFRPALNPKWLFGIGLVVYLLTRLIALPNFPVYFFCDEAANTVLAIDFVNNGFKDQYQTLFPAYFKDGDGPYVLGTSVYLQVIPSILFGKSIWVTRGVEVLVTLLTAIWLAFILRDIFKLSIWWSAPLLLAAVPTWFLHSRTGFGYTIMVAFYAGFLYYYLLYRTGKPRALYPALILGALSFYSYSSGQLVVTVTGALLFFSDLRYHWQQRRTTLWGLLLVLALALPQIRFMLGHPMEYAERFSMYNSYLSSDLALSEKVWMYGIRFVSSFNPLYWFFPNDKDLVMYTMKGYGNFPWWMLPFNVAGLWLAVRRFRSAEMRVVLIALLAAPTAAVLVEMASRRALAITVPFLLLGAMGLAYLADGFEKPGKSRWLGLVQNVPRAWWGYLLFGFLVVSSISMLVDALVNGPTWTSDYGISGVQYSAGVVYPAAQEYQLQHPERTVFISPNWLFQSEILRKYFLPIDTPIRMGTPDRFITSIDPALDRTTFILTPTDLEKALASGKFKDPIFDLTLPYPDGRTGFFFTRLAYRDDIQQVMQAETERRHQLVSGEFRLDKEVVRVKYSALDMGPIGQAFDGNPDTLIKTLEANPLVIELEFAKPKQMSGLVARIGSETVRFTITLEVPGKPPEKFIQEAIEAETMYRDVKVSFGVEKLVKSLRFEMKDVNAPDPSNVHLWEVTFY